MISWTPPDEYISGGKSGRDGCSRLRHDNQQRFHIPKHLVAGGEWRSRTIRRHGSEQLNSLTRAESVWRDGNNQAVERRVVGYPLRINHLSSPEVATEGHHLSKSQRQSTRCYRNSKWRHVSHSFPRP